jgi:hypothetical protein
LTQTGSKNLCYSNNFLILKVNWSHNFDEYFGEGVDMDSVVYLMLANYLIHEKYSWAITIAEVFNFIIYLIKNIIGAFSLL